MGVALVDSLVPVLTAATSTPRSCHFGLWIGWGDLHAGSHSSVLYRRAPWRFRHRMLRSRRERRRLEDTEGRLEAPLYAFVSACPVQPWWGGRDMLLFDGPLPGVAAIGTFPPFDERLRRRSPQWWWPQGQEWFVGTEIDYPWSYVAGTATLIEALVSDPNLETIRVDASRPW